MSAPRQDALPRLQSSPDLENTQAPTCVSDVVVDLARLSDRSSVPRLAGPIGDDLDMTPQESDVASFVATGTTLGGILERSPLTEDETLRCLARLITLGIVVVEAPTEAKPK
jgi:hypothetical protein